MGTGSYTPDRIVTNAELEQTYGFEEGWIEQRSGILERRHVAEDQATSDMATEAARNAMKAAGVTADEIDLLVVGTFTPDFGCPSTACLVQDRLGIDAPAFDVQAACSGFMYAFVTAAQYVATGNSRLALVVGADTNSRIVDPTDQRTAPLFGDGAGAVLISRGGPDQGLLCYQMGADGSGGPLLEMPAGGTRCPASSETVAEGGHYLHMDGRNVFKWAVRAVTETIELVLEKSELSPHDVSLYLLHQANARIIKAAMDPLGVPETKVWNNLQLCGNTSAASIPLALDQAYRAGRVEPGDTLLLSGFGAGLTWGTGLLRW
ncbi:3-oxoacyl-ACP synthase III family protein [Calycomorphotria hydatis]|uniref:3-oxoacyl-ACP synthase III family protein n=1 Tax=Calycomorphotria hydatis TaxID=2528027 RepID=UPI001E537807|nr:beta-ketoacyl-ACP synthase III [Calycomorphotria hydatis]